MSNSQTTDGWSLCELPSLLNGHFEGEVVVVKVDIAGIGIVFKAIVVLTNGFKEWASILETAVADGNDFIFFGDHDCCV